MSKIKGPSYLNRRWVGPTISGCLLSLAPLTLYAQGEGPIHSENPPQPPNSPTLQMPQRILDVLHFWFGPLFSPDVYPEDKSPLWFVNSSEIDRFIRENFLQDILKAIRGELNHWRETPRGRLALILLLDQFSRHIYRHKPQAFALNPMARGLVLEGLQAQDDQVLYPIERAFFYLPLEHAEDLAIQALSVNCYQQLVMQSPLAIKPQMQEFLRYAKLHYQQIARFGRFPHRNAILGRPSTPEEVLFLRQWGGG